jgi:hypothetical protein
MCQLQATSQATRAGDLDACCVNCMQSKATAEIDTVRRRAIPGKQAQRTGFDHVGGLPKCVRPRDLFSMGGSAWLIGWIG